MTSSALPKIATSARRGGSVSQPSTEPTSVSYMSLPHKRQLALLCLARFVDPLAATSINSYIFFQLRSFDPDASNATLSTRSGIVFAAKTAAQVCTGMLWGQLADSEWGGRRLVLSLGLLSSALAAVGYGLSRSFEAAVAWQVFGGAMNNNIALVRCVVAELNPEKKYRTRALLLLPLCANAGMLIGPLVGGLLSSVFTTGLFADYPYALPNFLIAVIYLATALGVALWLNETLEALQNGQASKGARLVQNCIHWLQGRPSSYQYSAIRHDGEVSTPTTAGSESTAVSLLPEQSASSAQTSKLPFRRIWTFNVCCTMLSHFIIAGHLGTFSSLWSIFLSNPVSTTGREHLPFQFSGGLGMSSRSVGITMSLLGAIGVTLQAVVYPTLNDKFGTIKTWRIALFIFPVVYLLAPFPSLVAARIDPSPESLDGKSAALWISMGTILLLFMLGRTGVTPATTLLINDCTPHPSVRGTIHATGTLMGNLSRSIFPFLALAIFGKGLEIGVVGLAFWCLAILAVLACVASVWVVEGSNGKEIQL